jgi:hypothetical protein
MKYFLLEPTYKKSTVEKTFFRRELEPLTGNPEDAGKWAYVTKELGWRWGSFLISVPETEEEVLEFVKSSGYDDVLSWAIDHGESITQGDEEVLPPNFSLYNYLVPSEDAEYVDVTEDYPEAEMYECWDGCWEDWEVSSTGTTPDVDIEEIEEAFSEDYEEGVEELGWTFVDMAFELHCNPKITPCDENGQVFETEEQEELDAV